MVAVCVCVFVCVFEPAKMAVRCVGGWAGGLVLLCVFVWAGESAGMSPWPRATGCRQAA